MTIAFDTVPESIPFERVQELVRSLGMETRDLMSLHIDRGAVTAEVVARNANGKPYFIGRGEDMRHATHRIVIPVTPAESVWAGPESEKLPCPADCDTPDACRAADSHVIPA